MTDTYVSVDNASLKTCVIWPNSAPLFSNNKGKNSLSSRQQNMAGGGERASASARGKRHCDLNKEQVRVRVRVRVAQPLFSTNKASSAGASASVRFQQKC